MIADIHDCQVAYRTAMAMANSMLSQGILSDGEYHKIQRVLADKYGQLVCNYSTGNTLLSSPVRGNMSATERGGNDGEKDRKN